MPIDIAMPVAHVTGGVNYATYYSGGNCVLGVTDYFNRGGCQGISLERDPAAPFSLLTVPWNLYAFTDGFISFQANSVVLRLPRELHAAAVQQHNSGRQFMDLNPRGPQLRHVIYAFPADPGAAVDDKIRAILNDAAHPGRNITGVLNPAGGTQTLQAYLAANPANINNALQDFRNGNIELYVQAGDVLGNFMNAQVEVRFLDSSGTFAPTAGIVNPITPHGRPLNPSYYLYLVRHAGNAANVNMRTSFAVPPANQNQTHPLDDLFSQASIAAAHGNPDQELNVSAAHPPKPLHVTIAVQNAGGANIADKGIHIAALGDWHESRNAADPFNTNAPVRWRNYGTMAGEANFNDYCRFLTQAKAGQVNLLPGGAAFDHQHAPVAGNHANRVRNYWTRYAEIFNAVGKALEIPCEILVAIACTETAYGNWYNQANFAASREMDVIRLEPLMVTIAAHAPVPLPNQVPALVTANAAHQGWLANYQNLAGVRVRQTGVPGFVLQAGGGANANIPVPWNGAAQVSAPNALTWNQLRDLIRDYPDNVKVSPGVMQTLVETAREDTQWIAQIYGNNYIQQIIIPSGGVNLVADNPPNNRGDLFQNWFGVSVDAAGNNTNVAANVDQNLTKAKRALHDVIAGGAHIKHRYNTVVNNRNLITDFDLPTVASGYNDGANVTNAFQPGVDPPADRWKKLFALMFFDENYPDKAPKLFNAAVELFNAAPPPNPLPAVRLWRT